MKDNLNAVMERDKDLLLPVVVSDSEDAVEEFRLPPPRTRRPKARKAMAEARIAASNSSVLSWKCCLFFIMVSVFITGILVLAFFLLNMQSDIDKLRDDIYEANIKIQRHISIEVSTKKLMEKLEQYKQRFSKLDLNNKLLVYQIIKLNKTIKHESTPNEVKHRLSAVAKDVDSMKSGMASTGGSIAKIQSEIMQHNDKFGSILTELKNIKKSIINTPTKNKTRLDKLTVPVSDQSLVHILKETMRQVNDSQNENIQRLAKEIYNNHVETDENMKRMEMMIHSVNTTHIADYSKLTENMVNFRNISDHKPSATVDGSSSSNVSQTIQEKMETYLKRYLSTTLDVSARINVSQTGEEKMATNMKNYTNLENGLKVCQLLSNSNHQIIQLMGVQVDKLQEQVELSKNSSFAYTNEILRLLNQSKTSEDMIMHHHQQLEEYKNSSSTYTNQILRLLNQSKTSEDMIMIHHQQLGEHAEKGSTSLIPSEAPKVVIPTTQMKSKTSEPKHSTITSKPTSHAATMKTETTKVVTEISNYTGTPGEECSMQCGIAEKCTKTEKGEKCVCQNGFAKLDKFCEDLNECVGERKCHVNATCRNTYGSYTCTCNDGFEGNGTHCQIKEECTLQCDIGKECAKTDEGYKCVCAAGLVLVGKNCLDLNECVGEPKCHINATCRNTYGSYNCTCNDGFEGNGTHCQIKEECPLQCDIGMECAKTDKGYKCVCAAGFALVGKNCLDVNECVRATDCHVYASCKNTYGSYKCTCNDGFEGDGIKCEGKGGPNNTKSKNIASTSTDTNVKKTTETAVISEGDSQVTAKPELSATTLSADSDLYLTPEMPDESGLYDIEKPDQTARKESDQAIPDFLTKPLKRKNKNNKISEDLYNDLNKFNGLG